MFYFNQTWLSETPLPRYLFFFQGIGELSFANLKYFQ